VSTVPGWPVAFRGSAAISAGLVTRGELRGKPREWIRVLWHAYPLTTYAYCPVAGTTIFLLPSNAFATTAVAAPRISAASEPTVNMP
jgi:hypothetical protein